MGTQLRAYTIDPGDFDRFVDAWRTHIVPLRIRFGFRIVAAWAPPERDRFVWVVEGDDFEDRDRRYYSSPERQAIPVDVAGLVQAMDVRMVDTVAW